MEILPIDMQNLPQAELMESLESLQVATEGNPGLAAIQKISDTNQFGFLKVMLLEDPKQPFFERCASTTYMVLNFPLNGCLLG